jgi:hypothetical protein
VERSTKQPTNQAAETAILQLRKTISHRIIRDPPDRAAPSYYRRARIIRRASRSMAVFVAPSASAHVFALEPHKSALQGSNDFVGEQC